MAILRGFRTKSESHTINSRFIHLQRDSIRLALPGLHSIGHRGRLRETSTHYLHEIRPGLRDRLPHHRAQSAALSFRHSRYRLLLQDFLLQEISKKRTRVVINY